MNNNQTNRIFGLDLLRCAAIIIVVLGHSSFLIKNYGIFPQISLPDGVDLFFVLSGYLVGSNLIRIIEKNQSLNFNTALTFLQRRWFRTLPNYFLFLIVNLVLIYFGLIKGSLNKYLVTYFFFLQNLYKPFDFLFWESWSLSVEEWFYLLFPLTVFLVFKFTKRTLKVKPVLLASILVFLVFPLVYRFLHYNPSLDFDLYIRKLVLTRLDTIGFGLLAAFMHAYYGHFWNKWKNLFFISGLVLLIFLVSVDFKNLFFLKTFYYSLIGFSVFLLIPKLEVIKNEPIPFKPVQFISLISYSMYLVHLPLVQIMSNACKPATKTESLILYFAYWLLTFLLSYFVYRFYEKPLMNLRDRFKVSDKLPK